MCLFYLVIFISYDVISDLLIFLLKIYEYFWDSLVNIKATNKHDRTLSNILLTSLGINAPLKIILLDWEIIFINKSEPLPLIFPYRYKEIGVLINGQMTESISPTTQASL